LVGILGNFGALSSFGWYGVITYQTILVISGFGDSLISEQGGPLREDRGEGISYRTHALVWLSSTAFAILPEVWPGDGGYGAVDRGGYECWIKAGDKEWLRLFYYVPLMAIIIQSFYLLWLVGRIACVDWGDEWGEVRTKTILRLVFFVFVFVVVWGEALVSRTLELVDENYKTYAEVSMRYKCILSWDSYSPTRFAITNVTLSFAFAELPGHRTVPRYNEG
jgi:hypothetical protein